MRKFFSVVLLLALFSIPIFAHSYSEIQNNALGANYFGGSRVARTSDSTIWVISGNNSNLYLRNSTDGINWNNVTQITTTDNFISTHESSMEVNGSDVLFIGYRKGTTHMYYNTYDTRTGTLGTEVQLSSATNVYQNIDTTMNSTGTMFMWYVTASGVTVARTNGITNDEVIVDATITSLGFSSIFADKNNTIHLFHTLFGGQDIYYYNSTNGGTTWQKELVATGFANPSVDGIKDNLGNLHMFIMSDFDCGKQAIYYTRRNNSESSFETIRNFAPELGTNACTRPSNYYGRPSMDRNGQISVISSQAGTNSILRLKNLTEGSNTWTATQNLTFYVPAGQISMRNSVFFGNSYDNITNIEFIFMNETSSNLLNFATISAQAPDTSAPTIQYQNPTPVNDSAQASNNVTINMTVTDASGIDTVIVELDGVNVTATSPSPNDYNVTFTGIAQGNHTFRTYANDTFGNLAVTVSRIFLVDQAIPTIIIFAPSPLNNSYQNSTTAIVNASVTNTGNLDNVSIEFDGVNYTAILTDTMFYHHSFTSLADGLHSFKYYANDTAGNDAVSPTTFFVVDITPPTIIITSPNGTFGTTTVPVNFTVSDNNQNNLTCFYSLDNGSQVAIAGCSNTSITTTSGNHTFKVFAQDLAGNFGNSTTVTFQILIPAAPITGQSSFGFSSLDRVFIALLQLLFILGGLIVAYYCIIRDGQPSVEKIIQCVVIVLLALMAAIVIGAFLA